MLFALTGVAQRLPGWDTERSTQTAAIKFDAGPTCEGGSGTEGRAEDEAECTEEATEDVRSWTRSPRGIARVPCRGDIDVPRPEEGGAALTKYGCPPSPSATQEPAGGNTPEVKEEERRSAAWLVGVLFALWVPRGVGGCAGASPPLAVQGGGLQPLLFRAKMVCDGRIAPEPPPLI